MMEQESAAFLFDPHSKMEDNDDGEIIGFGEKAALLEQSSDGKAHAEENGENRPISTRNTEKQDKATNKKNSNPVPKATRGYHLNTRDSKPIKATTVLGQEVGQELPAADFPSFRKTKKRKIAPEAPRCLAPCPRTGTQEAPLPAPPRTPPRAASIPFPELDSPEEGLVLSPHPILPSKDQGKPDDPLSMIRAYKPELANLQSQSTSKLENGPSLESKSNPKSLSPEPMKLEAKKQLEDSLSKIQNHKPELHESKTQPRSKIAAPVPPPRAYKDNRKSLPIVQEEFVQQEAKKQPDDLLPQRRIQKLEQAKSQLQSLPSKVPALVEPSNEPNKKSSVRQQAKKQPDESLSRNDKPEQPKSPPSSFSAPVRPSNTAPKANPRLLQQQQAKKPKKKPCPQDHEAAIDFLKLVRLICDRRPWPCSQRDLKSFLEKHLMDFSLGFQAWLGWLQERCDSAKNKDVWKAEAVRRLVHTFTKGLGCMSGHPNNLVWNIQKVNLLCNRNTLGFEEQKPTLALPTTNMHQDGSASLSQNTLQSGAPTSRAPVDMHQGGGGFLPNTNQQSRGPHGRGPANMHQDGSASLSDSNQQSGGPTGRGQDGSASLPNTNQQFRGPNGRGHSNGNPHLEEHVRTVPFGFPPPPPQNLPPPMTGAPINLVDSLELLVKAAQELTGIGSWRASEHYRNKTWPNDKTIAIECIGAPSLHLLAIATTHTTFIFDCIKLNPQEIFSAISRLLYDLDVLKVMHGLNRHLHVFAASGGMPLSSRAMISTFDTQLAVEYMAGEPCMGVMGMLGHLKLLPTTNAPQGGAPDSFARPLSRDTLRFCARNVQLLLRAKQTLQAMDDGVSFQYTQYASDIRAALAVETQGSRRIGFDTYNAHALTSFELLDDNEGMAQTPLVVSNCTSSLQNLLPDEFTAKLSSFAIQRDLTSIVLDYGTKPFAWVNGQRVFLGGENVATSHLAFIEEKVGGFQGKNRARSDSLHRIAAVRDFEGFIKGITIGVGRYVTGNADMIMDLLHSEKSILVLGERGSGKSTLLREISRLLAEKSNLFVVDTKNEMAGSGDVPHPSVGMARVMMVPPTSLDAQTQIVMECSQNHSPEVMVIDELRVESASEVPVSLMCKQRGTRLVAGAGGNLRKLIEGTTIGSGNSLSPWHSNTGSEAAQMRSRIVGGPSPLFDAVVELQIGNHHEWRVVVNTHEAVQSVLSGNLFAAQKRTRNPNTGSVQMDMVRL